MGREERLWCSAPTVVGQQAFSNYNGLGLHITCPLHYQSPGSSSPSTGAIGLPPPWLAVVIDASMAPEPLAAALEGLKHALCLLPSHTQLLLAVVDQVVSFFDLQEPQPQAWVLHSAAASTAAAAAAAAALPQLVRASGIHAVPVSACSQLLPQLLASVKHYPQPQSLERHLQTIAASLDLALLLLSSAAATWSAANAPAQQQQHQQHQQPPQQQQHRGQQQRHGQQQGREQQRAPMAHDARVILLTDVRPGAGSSPQQQQQHLAALTAQLDPKQATQMRALYGALGAKAADAGVVLDGVVGSAAAPALAYLQAACDACEGQLLLQPGLRPPLAASVVACAQRRMGWACAVTLQPPPGIRVSSLEVHGGAGALAAADVAALPAVEGGGARAVVASVQAGASVSASLELAKDLPGGGEPLSVRLSYEWTAREGRRVQQVGAGGPLGMRR